MGQYESWKFQVFTFIQKSQNQGHNFLNVDAISKQRTNEIFYF